MLAQLLHKHGLGARVASHRLASRERISSLDADGVRMVCISYLDIRGQPAHLRFLVRRLRQRFPRTTLLVGLWPMNDPAITDADVKSAIGADHYTSSLSDAVGICLAEAGGSSAGLSGRGPGAVGVSSAARPAEARPDPEK